MKLINKTLIAVALAAVSSFASADNFDVITAKSGNGHAMGLEYTSGGTAVGLQFKIKVPEGAVVDTSNALSGVKQWGTDHQFVVKYNDVEHYVVGMVFSDTNQAIPRGTFNLGTLSAKTKGNKGDQFEVIEFISADVNAKAIPSTSKMSREDEGNIQVK